MTDYRFPKLQPNHELPDPFLRPDGSRVAAPEEWPAQRAYLKEMLDAYMYGHVPPTPDNLHWRTSCAAPCCGGMGIRESVSLKCGPDLGICLDLTLIRPSKPGKCAFFVTYGKVGDDIAALLLRGDYGVAVFDREQLARDEQGMAHPFEEEYVPSLYPGYDWRALAVWGWGYSIVADFLLAAGYADPDALIATGHSRGGKTALCAAIHDERFAAAAIAGSGCGGTANFRYHGGRLGPSRGEYEHLGDMTNKDSFWYWLSDVVAAYGDHAHKNALKDEDLLPFDLHTARALVAPRPIISVDGLDDPWANPYGVRVSWRAAGEVYEFLGKPEYNAVHFRDGGHAYNREDWESVINFMDNTLRGRNLPRRYHLVDGDTPRLHYSWRYPVQSVHA